MTLDHFQIAVFLVSSGGKVRFMNLKAAEMLAAPKSPLVVIANQLTAIDTSLDELRRQIERAIALAHDKTLAHLDIIKVRNGETGEATSIMVVPIRDSESMGILAEPLAAVFVSDPSSRWNLR